MSPQIHVQLPELQQFSKERRISQFKQSKTSPLQESVRNTGSKKEALKRAENPKPKNKTPPPPQKNQNQKPKTKKTKKEKEMRIL
jgi:hypothetical protein